MSPEPLAAPDAVDVWQHFGPHGLIVSIGVRLNRFDAAHRQNEGLTVTPPFTLKAMVDTGSSKTFFARSIMEQLQARPTGRQYTAHVSSEHVDQWDEFCVDLIVPYTGGVGGGWRSEDFLCSVGPIGFGSEMRPYDAVIGLDVLLHCRLTVDGRTRRFRLEQAQLSS